MQVMVLVMVPPSVEATKLATLLVPPSVPSPDPGSLSEALSFRLLSPPASSPPLSDIPLDTPLESPPLATLLPRPSQEVMDLDSELVMLPLPLDIPLEAMDKLSEVPTELEEATVPKLSVMALRPLDTEDKLLAMASSPATVSKASAMVPSQLASTDRLHQQILTLNSLLMLVVDNDLPVMFFVLHSLMCIDERLRFIFAPIHRRNGVNLQL